MGNPSDDLRNEVEPLVESAVTEEAIAEVQKRFETALIRLSPESRGLLERYFAGASAETISRDSSLPLNAVREWLSQAKRELMGHLRVQNKARQ